MLIGGFVSGELVYESPAGAVVARVRTEEAPVAVVQFLLSVCLEGLDVFVVRSASPFVLEACLMQPVMRGPFSEPGGARPEVLEVFAEGSVEQSDLDRVAGADRAERWAGEP